MASPPPLVPKLNSIFASSGFPASQRASSQMIGQVTSTSTFFNLTNPKHPTVQQYVNSTRKKRKQINLDLVHHSISAKSDSDEGRHSRVSNQIHNEEERLQSKQQRYEDFLRQLPPLLSGIEDKYDFDRLTPLLKTHLRNLDSLEPPKANLPLKELRNRESNQRQIFQLAKYEYNRDNERNSYVDSILTNYGLAQNQSNRDSEKYQTIISQHNNKMAQFKQDRKAIVASTEREQPLSAVQELMLEKKKARVMRFVEQNNFVQVDFVKLRRERSEIDKIIKEAEDQNFKFLEPEAYNKQVFKRNMQTEATNQQMRNMKRISIIEKSFESFQNRRNSQQVKSDQRLFNDMRRTAIDIFKTAHTNDIKPQKESIPVQEIQAKLDLVFSDSNLRQLNSNNKKYIHLRVVQKLKQKRLPEKDNKKLKVEEAQQQASENLLSMADPYIKQQFKLFQKTLNKQKGPDFLQRMRSDQEERDDINFVKSAQKTSDVIQDLLEFSPRLRRDGVSRLMSNAVLYAFQPQFTVAAKRESEPELQKLSALIQPPQPVDNTRVNEIKQILGLNLSRVIKQAIEQTSGGQSPFLRPRGRGLTNQIQIALQEEETPELRLKAEDSF